MPRVARRRTMKILVTLPDGLIEDLDNLAEEADVTRSEVIESLLGYCFGDQKIIDEVYPEEDEEEEEAEEAESEA